MKTEQLALFLISPDSTVVEAMQRIDRNARGILFVTNEQQKLLGVVTDGDIRRWLIRTGELKAPVSGLMNTEPKRISRKEHAKAHEVMVQHSITALPVVTTKGVVSDILFRDEQVAKKKKPQGILKEVPVVIMAGGKGTWNNTVGRHQNTPQWKRSNSLLFPPCIPPFPTKFGYFECRVVVARKHF